VVKTRYRERSLTHHPDKAPTKKREYAEERFKMMKKAFETLTDAKRKIDYDSSLDFDDAVPSVKDYSKNPDKYFALFGAAFKRNARFSELPGVPLLGDMDTPKEVMDEFWDFWFSFKSWREFTHMDTHTPENANDRDEKRWMEKKNAAERKKLKKEEMVRMRKLVDNAQQCDPRIQAAKQAVKDAKKAKA
jgi:DnaJ family protein C protein 2